jgi:hypothetical protein
VQWVLDSRSKTYYEEAHAMVESAFSSCDMGPHTSYCCLPSFTVGDEAAILACTLNTDAQPLWHSYYRLIYNSAWHHCVDKLGGTKTT